MANLVFIKHAQSEDETLELGGYVAGLCKPSTVIYLCGELGTGKTTFARGFLQGVGYTGKVKSPTYTLVEPYALTTHTIYHFDLYRLKDPHELEWMGVQDYFAGEAICLVEWPDLGATFIPAPDLSCRFHATDKGRHIQIEAHTANGLAVVKQLMRMQED